MTMISRRSALAGSAAVAAGLGLGRGAQAKTTLRLGHGLAKGHPVDVSLELFAKLVAERSKGEVEIKVFPAGQLGQQRELIEQLQAGALDFAHANASPLAAFEPAFGVFDTPFLIRDTAHFFKVVDGPVGREILEAGKAKALLGLAYQDSGTRSFYAKKPLKTPEDLKGLKIRVQPGPIATRMVNLLGAAATPLAWGELYTALQSGVVDGAENNVTALTLAKHGEVMKFYSRDEHTRVPDVVLASALTFTRLKPAEQELVRQAALDSSKTHNETWAKELAKAEQDAVKMGVTFVDADKAAFRKAVQPMYDDLKSQPAVAALADKIQAVQ
jgi:tripartite ATP-independent transporter DctP family solute receptor